MWALAPSFEFVGGTPTAPRQGASPLDPPLPTPVGLGFAGVLGPTRGKTPPNFPLSLAGKGGRRLGRKGGTSPRPPGPPLRPYSGRVCPLPETGNGVRGDILFLAGLHGEIGGRPRLGRRAAKGVCAW